MTAFVLRLVWLAALSGAVAAAAPAEVMSLEKPGPHAVRVLDFDLPDPADKPLPLRAYVPAGSGPFPVIVFSHGLGGSRNGFGYLSTHWASHGFVCLHPTHNDAAAISANPGAGPKKQRENSERTPGRAKDIALLLRSLPALSELRPELRGKIDAGVVGVAGHSAGAFAAQVAGGAAVAGGRENERAVDPSIKALISISGRGVGRGGFADDSWSNLRLPFLTITGARDTGSGYFGDQTVERRMDSFRLSPPGDKFLLFIEAANHSSFGGVAGARGETPLTGAELETVKRVMKTVTIAFWRTYLTSSRGGDAVDVRPVGECVGPACSAGGEIAVSGCDRPRRVKNARGESMDSSRRGQTPPALGQRLKTRSSRNWQSQRRRKYSVRFPRGMGLPAVTT